MSTSADDAETHPGQNLSVSQLLCAAKKQMQDTGSVGWATATLNEAETEDLERDASQVLSPVRSVENASAPINKLPTDVFTLIPDHWQDNDRDPNLIALTHVCRRWRDVLTSHASLWSRLDFANVDKTRAYLERSKPLPLDIRLEEPLGTSHWDEALQLVVPHTSRLKTLSISGDAARVFPTIKNHFHRPAPFLEKLVIDLVGDHVAILHGGFPGYFPSLRDLRLTGTVIPSPRSKMSNLTTFTLRHIPGKPFPVTWLLSFFESAPELRYVHLHDSIPGANRAPAERLVPLPHLKELSISEQPAHSTLLNHLSIPIGATVKLEFSCSGNESPLDSYLPESSTNLHNIHHTSAVNLCLGTERRFLRLRGPGGELCVLGNWTCNDGLIDDGTSSFLRSLRKFDLSRSLWLTTRWCNPTATTWVPIEDWPVYQTLHSMKSLHTLTLIQSTNRPFILSLNPAKNPSNIALCPNLKEISFYVEHPGQLYTDELLEMAEERASRGVKLSVVTIIGIGEFAPPKDVFQLRKHVSRLECKLDEAPPEWDVIPEPFEAFDERRVPGGGGSRPCTLI